MARRKYRRWRRKCCSVVLWGFGARYCTVPLSKFLSIPIVTTIVQERTSGRNQYVSCVDMSVYLSISSTLTRRGSSTGSERACRAMDYIVRSFPLRKWSCSTALLPSTILSTGLPYTVLSAHLYQRAQTPRPTYHRNLRSGRNNRVFTWFLWH